MEGEPLLFPHTPTSSLSLVKVRGKDEGIRKGKEWKRGKQYYIDVYDLWKKISSDHAEAIEVIEVMEVIEVI